MPPGVVSSGREAGSASVELIAVVPFLLLAILAVAQIAMAGQALWSAAVAARAGARASMVGGRAPAAARRALPPAMRDVARIEAPPEPSSGGPGTSAVAGAAGSVTVRVFVPSMLPGLPEMPVSVSAGLGPPGAGGGGGR